MGNGRRPHQFYSFRLFQVYVKMREFASRLAYVDFTTDSRLGHG